MKKSTRWESILGRVCIGTVFLSAIPWTVVTFYLGFQARWDIRLSLDSDGLPIVSQFVTLVFFYFLPWVLFVALITVAAFGISSLYWYVKIQRRLRLLKKPVAA